MKFDICADICVPDVEYPMCKIYLCVTCKGLMCVVLISYANELFVVEHITIPHKRNLHTCFSLISHKSTNMNG